MTDAITAKRTRRFGSGVAEWTAGLPALVADCARRWRLDVGTPFDGGATSVAIRVTMADGEPAVLKLSPDAPSLAEQAGMLRLFAPSGRVPAVLADAAGALLLEAVQPGTDMDDVPQQPTPAEFAELLAALHAVDPPPGVHLPQARQLTDEFVRGGVGQLAEPVVAARLHRSDFERALEELDVLSPTVGPTVLLHCDIGSLRSRACRLDAASSTPPLAALRSGAEDAATAGQRAPARFARPDQGPVVTLSRLGGQVFSAPRWRYAANVPSQCSAA
jgi:streptomycin 6-kinase